MTYVPSGKRFRMNTDRWRAKVLYTPYTWDTFRDPHGERGILKVKSKAFCNLPFSVTNSLSFQIISCVHLTKPFALSSGPFLPKKTGTYSDLNSFICSLIQQNSSLMLSLLSYAHETGSNQDTFTAVQHHPDFLPARFLVIRAANAIFRLLSLHKYNQQMLKPYPESIVAVFRRVHV